MLYHRLKEDGVEPWLDEEELVGGQDWEREISKAVRGADVVIVCLSPRSVTAQGYVQKEIKDALDIADEQPEDTIFLIPLKLEACEVPTRLRRWQWVNLFEEKGYERLLKSLQYRSHTLSMILGEQRLPAETASDASVTNKELRPSFAVPLAIVVADKLAPLVEHETPVGVRFRESLEEIRQSIYYDLGVLLPTVYISKWAGKDSKYDYFIAIKEVPASYGKIKPDSVFVSDLAERLKVFGLTGEDITFPSELKPGTWLPASQRESAELAGLKVREPQEVILLHFNELLKRHAYEFIGIQEAQYFLDFVAQGAPRLVEAVVPQIISIYTFRDVLQRLVEEGISIRDIKSILDAIAEWGLIDNDSVKLTEYVRTSMKRYISFRYTGGRDTLYVYLLDPEIEDVIRGAIRRTSTGSYLSLDPDIVLEIHNAIRHDILIDAPGTQKPVIITDMELRRFVRKLTELEFPTISILSYQELTPELNVQPLGRITMLPPALPDAFLLDDKPPELENP